MCVCERESVRVCVCVCVCTLAGDETSNAFDLMALKL